MTAHKYTDIQIIDKGELWQNKAASYKIYSDPAGVGAMSDYSNIALEL